MNKYTGEKQIRFEQFLNRLADSTEKELALLEEIFQKHDAGISGEEMEKNFYDQCAEYFEIIDFLDQLQNKKEQTESVTEYKGVLQ